MSTEEILLTRWQSLDLEKQAQVLAFIENLSRDNQKDNSTIKNYQPQTELGKKLWAIRQDIIKNSEIKLLNWDDIETEMDEIRGKN
jgi:hypothetical protein